MMEVKQCERGHFYDASVYSSCPQCAEEMGNAPVREPESYDPTTSVGGIGKPDPFPGDIGVTMPPFQNVGGRSDNGPMIDDPKPPKRDKTLIPAVGWLVCVEGPEKGKDYRIQSGYNYIGRSESMTICINDQKISRERHAVIAYDRKNKVFKFAPYMGENAVEVNGEMIMGSVQVSAYDELTIGNTTLIFIPLCGERFNWDEG